jgi:hypothetical protein
MQEKFRPMISYFPEIVNNSNRVLQVRGDATRTRAWAL